MCKHALCNYTCPFGWIITSNWNIQHGFLTISCTFPEYSAWHVQDFWRPSSICTPHTLYNFITSLHSLEDVCVYGSTGCQWAKPDYKHPLGRWWVIVSGVREPWCMLVCGVKLFLGENVWPKYGSVGQRAKKSIMEDSAEAATFIFDQLSLSLEIKTQLFSRNIFRQVLYWAYQVSKLF